MFLFSYMPFAHGSEPNIKNKPLFIDVWPAGFGTALVTAADNKTHILHLKDKNISCKTCLSEKQKMELGTLIGEIYFIAKRFARNSRTKFHNSWCIDEQGRIMPVFDQPKKQ
jgi:hypothetical protein